MPGFAGPHANGEYRLPKQRIGAGTILPPLSKVSTSFLIRMSASACSPDSTRLASRAAVPLGHIQFVAAGLFEFRDPLFQHTLDADVAEYLDLGGSANVTCEAKAARRPIVLLIACYPRFQSCLCVS